MNIDKTGGPAFPTSEENYTRTYSATGMTCREYFAAHAPITMHDAKAAVSKVSYASGNPYEEPSGAAILDMLVAMCYGYADRMIAEGAK